MGDAEHSCSVCQPLNGQTPMGAYRPHTFGPDCWCAKDKQRKFCWVAQQFHLNNEGAGIPRREGNSEDALD